MLEAAIDRLTTEVQMLRAAIERQTLALQQQTALRGVPSPAPAAFLTERAVADLTGLSVATIRRWCLFKQGPSYSKFGAAVRYPHAELMDWLETQEKRV